VEAEIARQAFRGARPQLRGLLRGCASGRELIDRGLAQDVEVAAGPNVSAAAPLLVKGAYIGRSKKSDCAIIVRKSINKCSGKNKGLETIDHCSYSWRLCCPIEAKISSCCVSKASLVLVSDVAICKADLMERSIVIA